MNEPEDLPSYDDTLDDIAESLTRAVTGCATVGPDLPPLDLEGLDIELAVAATPTREVQSLDFSEAVAQAMRWVEILFEKMQLPDVEIEVEADPETMKAAFNIASVGRHTDYFNALLSSSRSTGRIMEAMQNLLRETLGRLTGRYIEVSFDIQNYLKNRTREFQSVAYELAAVTTKLNRSITIAGLSSFDRRVIHNALADNNDVETNSVGQGAFRKLSIEPK